MDFTYYSFFCTGERGGIRGSVGAPQLVSQAGGWWQSIMHENYLPIVLAIYSDVQAVSGNLRWVWGPKGGSAKVSSLISTGLLNMAHLPGVTNQVDQENTETTAIATAT